MDIFQSLSKTVEQPLREGRIGTPVAIRIVAHTTSDHGRVEPLLTRAVQLACQWLGESVLRVSAQGGVEAGQISALIGFATGATALVSAGCRGVCSPVLEVVVVGNRGILSWEGAIAPEEIENELAAQPLSGHVQAVMRAVHRSLKAARVVEVGKEAGGSADTAQNVPRPETDQPRTDPPSQRAALAPPYGVLLVAGARTHQEDYARALAADPRCRLVGVTDEAGVSPRRQALNERLATELGIPLLPDLGKALARDDVQIVSICAEPERRAPIIVRCADAGKHLYLDKPLAASVEEAAQVVGAIRKAGVVSQMFSQVHTAPAARARQLVKSGALGELSAIHCDLFFAKGQVGTAHLGSPRTESRRPARFETVDAKRELYNVGVYPLVFLHWLLGRAVRKVSATTSNFFFQEHQRNDMEDFGMILMELDGKLTATLAAGRTGWRSHPMGGVNRICLVGTKAVACVDAFRPRLEVWAEEPPWTSPRTLAEDPMGFWRSTPLLLGMTPKRAWVTPDDDKLADAHYFLDCVEHGHKSDVSVEVGAAVLKVLMAAYESAATGQTVELR